jgi:hypothetical protein
MRGLQRESARTRTTAANQPRKRGSKSTDEKKAPEGAFSGLLPTGFGR